MMNQKLGLDKTTEHTVTLETSKLTNNTSKIGEKGRKRKEKNSLTQFKPSRISTDHREYRMAKLGFHYVRKAYMLNTDN